MKIDPPPLRPPPSLLYGPTVLGIGLGVACAISPSVRGIPGAWFVSYALPVAGMIAAIIGMARRYSRFERLGGRMCLKCGFSLEGLEDTGLCPECGSPFDLADSKRFMRGAQKRD